MPLVTAENKFSLNGGFKFFYKKNLYRKSNKLNLCSQSLNKMPTCFKIGSGGKRVMMHMWRPENNLQEAVLSVQLWGSWKSNSGCQA